jgi:hypothetical protein
LILLTDRPSPPSKVVTESAGVRTGPLGETAKPGIRKPTGVINEDLYQVSRRSGIGGSDCIAGNVVVRKPGGWSINKRHKPVRVEIGQDTHISRAVFFSR